MAPVVTDRSDQRLAARLDDGVRRLRTKLAQVDVASLGLSDYASGYLRGWIANGGVRVAVYAHLLSLALAGGRPAEATTLVDYGGGNGLLSLLAREIGVGQIVYNDIYDLTRNDARRLAAALNLEADHYVLGDIRDVVAYLRREGIEPTVMCSNDVIEHVYDLDMFLRSIPDLARGSLRVVAGSEANGANPRILRRTVRFQRQVELEDRPVRPESRPLDSVRAYRSVRRDIIRAHRPSIQGSALEMLAARTRGMIRSEIERTAEEYVSTGALPPAPSHPTNTCDPLTGNWAERLMDPGAIAESLRRLGFEAVVLPGRYAPFRGVKGLAAFAANAAIAALGGEGLRLAPYYVIVADRKLDETNVPAMPPGSSGRGS